MPMFIRKLPVQTALTAFCFYLLTLSHGVTIDSLPLTAKLSGWDPAPMESQSLLWLTTLPLRCLPAGWIAPMFNLYSAALAGLILASLAWSLEMVAWDFPLATLGRYRKVPILLASVICGLNYNFWREATAATGEMIQLLLLAAAIGCLFKYRATRTFHWMYASALAWGLGMAENWIMILALPLFVIALFWLAKFEIFRAKRLRRLALTGLVGFLTFFLRPILQSFAEGTPSRCLLFCRHALGILKDTLATIRLEFWIVHRPELFVVVIFFLVPILPVFFRERYKITQGKGVFARLMVWGGQSLFLLIITWLAFDPAFGPRQVVARQTGINFSYLTFDYLLAFSAGILVGNLMLAFLAKLRHRNRRPRLVERIGRRSGPVFVGFLSLVTVALLVRNLPPIWLVNRQPLTQFGEMAIKSLPPDGGVIISDEPLKLMTLQAALAREGNTRWAAADLLHLTLLDYRQRLSHKYPGDWMTDAGHGNLTQRDIIVLLTPFAQTGHAYYLEDNFGFLFESLDLVPNGFIYQISPASKDDPSFPSLSAASISATEQFWDNAAPELDSIEQIISPRQSALSRRVYHLLARAGLQPVPPAQTRQLADWYSVALNDWGVQLQRAGDLTAAHTRFLQAHALNRNNFATFVNLQCNTNLLKGVRMDLSDLKTLGSQFDSFNHLGQFIHGFGIMDQPSFCYLLGTVFFNSNLSRQSLQQYERAHFLAPDVIEPQLALVPLYNRFGRAQQARRLITQLRSEAASSLDRDSFESDMDLLEAESWLAQTNTANANEIVQSFVKKRPNDTNAENMALHTFFSYGDYANALQISEIWLTSHPRDIAAMLNKALICRKLGRLSDALSVYDQALAMTNLPAIRILRDQAYVDAGRLDAAQDDLLQLDATTTNHLSVEYGLSQIALQRHDTNTAILWLKQCLTNTPADSAIHQSIRGRISALQGSLANNQ